MFEIFCAYLFFLLEIIAIESLSLSRRCKNFVEIRLCFLYFFILAAFRDISIVNDTKPYVTHFLKVGNYTSIFQLNTLDRFGLGYQFTENILHIFVNDSFGFIFLTSLLVLLPSFLFIRKYSYLPGLSCILYFVMNLYITHIGVLRQTFALVFAYLVFYFLTRRQNLLALLLILIACTLHNSATFIFLYFIAFYIKISRKKVWLVLLLLGMFFSLYSYFLPYVVSSDSKYLTSSSIKGFFSLVGVASTAFSLTIFLIVYYLKRNLVNNIEYDNVFFWFMIFQVFMSVLSIRIWALTRYNMYLTPFLMIYITNLVNNQPSQQKKALMSLFVVCVLSIYFFMELYLRPEWFSIIPYKFTNFI